MTQKQLILEYVKEYGSIVPAKMSGEMFMGKMFGSETSRRCRELRADGRLRSEGLGKFERFYLPQIIQVEERTVMLTDEQYHQKLQQLRQEWLREIDPSKRKIIEARGKAIKSAMAAKAAGMNRGVQEAYEALL